VSFFLDYHS